MVADLFISSLPKMMELGESRKGKQLKSLAHGLIGKNTGHQIEFPLSFDLFLTNELKEL
jgi:hypothetical protein